MTLPRPVLLYEESRAPNPRRVRMFMSEKGIEIPVRQIDIMSNHHRSPEYLNLTGGYAHVPALALEDRTILTETMAICRYLEALYPRVPLMGDDPLAAAQIEMWQRRIEFGLLQHVAAVARHTNPRMQVLEVDQCGEWGEANRPRVLAAMRVLDSRLGESAYVAGREFSVADITAFVALEFMKVTRIEIPEDCDAVLAWMAGIRARPSAMA